MCIFFNESSAFTNFSCRVLLDRAHSDWDDVYHGLDPDSPVLRSRSLTQQHSMDTSHTSTDTSSPSSSPPNLSQLLLNIKACRWRHFKPRATYDPDNPEHWSTRRHRRGCLIRPISTLRTRGGPASSNRPVPPPTPGESSIVLLMQHYVCVHPTCMFDSRTPQPQNAELYDKTIPQSWTLHILLSGYMGNKYV